MLDKLVELEVVERFRVAHDAAMHGYTEGGERRVLCAMEDTLAVYHAKRPVVCFDEGSRIDQRDPSASAAPTGCGQI